jgi:hypothetical protein
MRVAIILPFAVFGAAEDYALILACGLQPTTCVDVVVVHLDQAVPEAAARALDAAGVESVAVSESAVNSTLRLRRTLRSIEPDVVHVNQVFLPAIMAAGLPSGSATVVRHTTPRCGLPLIAGARLVRDR